MQTLAYYIAYEFPKTRGLLERLMDDEIITIKGGKEYFGVVGHQLFWKNILTWTNTLLHEK